MNADVLILVEDPGAAAYVAGVPEALARRGLSARVLAMGHAVATLKHAGEPHDAVRDEAEVLAQLATAAPRVIAVGTAEHPNALAHAAVAEARRRGIASVGLVDGPANAASRFRGASSESLRHAPDWIAVPDEATRQEFIQLGMAAGRVSTCEHPRWDILYRLRDSEVARSAAGGLRQRWNRSDSCAVVLFAAELSRGIDGPLYRAPEYTLAGTSGADGRTEIVLEEFLMAARRIEPRPCLVLRLHPKTPRGLYASYVPAFDAVSENEPASDAILAADLVVGLTSVILDEALVLGRAVLSIVPRASEAAWLVGARLELIPVAYERASIVPALQRALAGESTAPRTEVERLLPKGAADNVARLIAEAGRMRFAA